MVYRTSPIKRKRRSKAELKAILDYCLSVIEEEGQLTIRHLFYRCVAGALLEKTEREYKKLCGYLSRWRRNGAIAWSTFTDNTRWRYGGREFGSAEEALENTASTYRRNLWLEQPVHLEIWCEKEAIISLITPETEKWGVPVFPCRGFASLSSLYNAAELFREEKKEGREVVVCYLGDHDPSGISIDRSITGTLAKDFDVEIDFRRIAVTPEQIVEHTLPTRPVKSSDTRAKGWQGGCVEVDALRPIVIRELVRGCIHEHVDPHAWKQTLIVEREEQAVLAKMPELFRKAHNGKR